MFVLSEAAEAQPAPDQVDGSIHSFLGSCKEANIISKAPLLGLLFSLRAYGKLSKKELRMFRTIIPNHSGNLNKQQEPRLSCLAQT